MTTNLTMLLQLAVVMTIWVAGTAFICYRLAKKIGISSSTSAQIGTILSLVPPLNILYISFLMYKRVGEKAARSNSEKN